MTMSKREYDINGFVEIKDNPISKVGVFPYSGKSIDESLPPDDIFWVYRPAEELAKLECIESFKLQPFINGHTFLGDGYTPAEEKGVEGVIGEQVRFDGEYLLGNLKIFSKSILKIIQDGIKQVSLAYRCRYEKAQGVFNGMAYQFIQRDMRGNHAAVVPDGRCGPDVAVLDSLTFDEAELKKMVDTITEDNRLEQLSADVAALKSTVDSLAEVIKAQAKAADADEDKEKEDKKAEAEDEDEDKEDKKGEAEAEDEDDKKAEAEDEDEDKEEKEDKKAADAKGFDAQEFKKEFMKEFHAKNQLAEQLSWFVGAFDHAEFTLSEVADYGLRKLGLTAPKGAETSVLNAYLAAKQPAAINMVAADSKETKGDSLRSLINSYS